MIKHIWSVLCQRSVVDSQSNNISIFDVFEALQVDINPTPQAKGQNNPEYNIPLQYQVVTLISKEKEDARDTKYSIRVTLVNSEGKKKILVSQDLTFLAHKKRMRSINQIQGLPVSQSGIYHFIVELRENDGNFQKVADLPLEVKLNIKNLTSIN